MNTNGNTQLTTIGANAFEQYGNAAAARTITGELWRFSKFGEYRVGGADSDRALTIGTELVVDMNTLSVGWLHWGEDGKPAERQMGLVADGFAPKRRQELGDDDQSRWGVGADGKPVDPWQFVN